MKVLVIVVVVFLSLPQCLFTNSVNLPIGSNEGASPLTYGRADAITQLPGLTLTKRELKFIISNKQKQWNKILLTIGTIVSMIFILEENR